MTTATSPLPIVTRTSTLRTGWPCLRRAWLMMLLLAAAAPRLSADEVEVRDLYHEVMVRAALAKDAQLGPLNIVVRVKNREATLSGWVPSRELAKQALDVAKHVPEIREVRDKLAVQSESAGQLSAWLNPAPKSAPHSPGQKTILPAFAAASGPDTGSKMQLSALGVLVPVNPAPTETATHGVALLPPGISESPSNHKDNSPERNLQPPDVAAITSAVQGLLQAEDRFRRLRFEVKQGKVYLSGIVQRWADLEEFARVAGRIPGVEGIVLQEVKTDATRK